MQQRAGPQTVSLNNPSCIYVGIVAHELLHTIGNHLTIFTFNFNKLIKFQIKGFQHEQNRPDRDNYLTINWKNIEKSINIKRIFLLPELVLNFFIYIKVCNTTLI